MKKPKYLICTNQMHLPGKTLILNTAKPPYYIGMVVFFQSNLSYAEYTAALNGRPFAQIEGYRGIVEFKGSLTGQVFVHTSIAQELTQEMQLMAKEFHLSEINNNVDVYQKYLF